MSERIAPRAVLVLVGAAAFVVAVAGVRAASGIVGPVFLALVISITLHPLRPLLERRGIPNWAASVVMLLAAYAVLLLLTLALIISIGQLADLIPNYSAEIRHHLTDSGNWLSDRGVGTEQAEAAVKSLDPDRIVSLATTILSSLVSILSSVFFLATMLLFIAFDSTAFRRSLGDIAPDRPDFVAALAGFALTTRKHMSVSATFGLVVAVIDTVALSIIGVPGAFVWGVLAFVTNFIPHIGFVIGVIPPAVIALLEGGPWLMVGVIAVYAVVNLVVQSIIQPRVVGGVVGLSPTLTFVSLVFWAWALGALGALMAVPLTLLVKALLVDADPDARWMVPLLSGKPASGPAPDEG
jgi:predicted PurR-regulated permease PerM